jgi:poly-beta-hydroxybutyrate-responsive repressor
LPGNLLEAWVLLLLKQWSAHGYWLLQWLNQAGFGPIDHTTLYKELRNLEKRGLVSSTWDTTEAGPARRLYSLTGAGEEMLQSWAETMTQYQQMMASFFQLYASAFTGLVPGMPPLQTTEKARDRRDREQERTDQHD